MFYAVCQTIPVWPNSMGDAQTGALKSNIVPLIMISNFYENVKKRLLYLIVNSLSTKTTPPFTLVLISFPA